MTSNLSGTALQFAFVCPLSAGMHARPASQFARVVNSFASECVLTNLRNQHQANAKSVLSIIAADVREGDQCSVQVAGPDEQSAYTVLRQFVEEQLPHCDLPLAGHSSSVTKGIPRVLKNAGVTCYSGVCASPGLGRGKVVFARTMSVQRSFPEYASDREQEQKQIERAMAAVRERLSDKLAKSVSQLDKDVLQADLAIADDVLFAAKLSEAIARGRSAGRAVLDAGRFFTDLLLNSESEGVRDKASDVEEISMELLDQIYGTVKPDSALQLDGPSILVAETLGPQQFLMLDRSLLQGLVLEHAGANSHALILARSHGVPTVVGIRNAANAFSAGQEIIVDASRGLVLPHIGPEVQRYYRHEATLLERQHDRLRTAASLPAQTRDGIALEVAANASSSEELKAAFTYGADGIGLFRTEITFLDRQEAPGEEEQSAVYEQAASLAQGRRVIIRTLDLGADKSAPYLNFSDEENPSLGTRGVRAYARHHDLLQAQLRAILRASAHGNVQIMVPMVSCLQEVRDFKTHLEKAKDYLRLRNVPYQASIPIGIMVEVPSVAFMIDQFCSEVDFFSIGTNDLAQYFFAADRNNAEVAELSNVLHPGFLRFLKHIVDEVHAAGRWVGLCGDMAALPLYLPLFVGLGLDEISLPAGVIPETKQVLRECSATDCKALLQQVIDCTEVADVSSILLSARAMAAPSSLLHRDLVELESDSNTKEEVIQELVDLLHLARRTLDRQKLEDDLWAREGFYATGLGFGFATPHCKSDAVSASSIAVLKLRESIDWGSVDTAPVRMVICIVMRANHPTNNHMQVFSVLARKLMEDTFRQQLLKTADPDALVNYLAEQLNLQTGEERLLH